MNYLEGNPARWGYLLSRLLGLVGLVSLLGAVAFSIYRFISRPTASSLKEISLPGKTDVLLEKAGVYNFYYDADWKEPPQGRQLKIKFKPTGEEIAVNDNSSYREPGRGELNAYVKFATFAINQPGDYEITTIYPKGPVMGSIYLGATSEPDYWVALVAALGGVVLLTIGRLLASVIFSLRKRAVEAGGARLVYGEKGISVYDNVIFLKRAYSATELHKNQINYVHRTTEFVRGPGAEVSQVLQGVRINYQRAGREHARIIRSKSYSTLYHAIKRAGYQTRWEPPEMAGDLQF